MREQRSRDQGKWQLEDIEREKNNYPGIDVMNGDQIVDFARAVGGKLGKQYPDDQGNDRKGMDLKMNQIRKFLDALRKIEKDVEDVKLGNTKEKTWDTIKNELSFLRPKLAYAAGRSGSKFSGATALMTVLDPAIEKAVQNPEKSFYNLLRFMEAIVAFHSYYGGTN